MSIRDELREKRYKKMQEDAKKKEELDSKAETFIEEFIIPLFRSTFELRPYEQKLRIEFHSNIGCWCYTTSAIEWENKVKSPYDYETVSHAVNFAAKHDIDAFESDDGSGGTTIVFRLDIS